MALHGRDSILASVEKDLHITVDELVTGAAPATEDTTTEADEKETADQS